MNDVKLQSEKGFPVDENLRPIKVGGKSTALEVAQNGNGCRVTGDLEVTGDIRGNIKDMVLEDVSVDSLTTNSIVSTNLTIDDSGDINLTPAAGCDVNIPADKGLTFGDDGEKIEGDGTDLTIVSSRNLNIDTNGAITLNADLGSITLDSAVGGFIMKGAGSTSEFSVANSAYAGMIIGYTTVGIDTADDSKTLGTSFAVTDAEHKVNFIAPPSGVVEIFVSVYGDFNRRQTTFGLSDNATYNALDVTHEHVVAYPPTSLGDRQINHRWVVTGLTAGTQYEWWLGGMATHAFATTLRWGGNVTGEYAPFIMKATALPTAITDFAVYG